VSNHLPAGGRGRGGANTRGGTGRGERGGREGGSGRGGKKQQQWKQKAVEVVGGGEIREDRAGGSEKNKDEMTWQQKQLFGL